MKIIATFVGNTAYRTDSWMFTVPVVEVSPLCTICKSDPNPNTLREGWPIAVVTLAQEWQYRGTYTSADVQPIDRYLQIIFIPYLLESWLGEVTRGLYIDQVFARKLERSPCQEMGKNIIFGNRLIRHKAGELTCQRISRSNGETPVV